MSLRVILTIAVIAAVALVFFAWNQTAMRSRTPAESGAGPGAVPDMPVMPEMVPPDTDPGVAWTKPARWQESGARGMRLATYTIPAAGAAEPAECAVYYFGPGQGGGVEANLERWIGEFQDPGRKAVTTGESGGIALSRVDVRGTYVAHAMGAGASDGERGNWALLGAIAQGPNGDLFFKLIGPAVTVEGAAKDFDAMIASLRKR